MFELIVWALALGAVGEVAVHTSLMAFAAGALVFGTLWFWLLAVVAVVAVFAFIDHEDGIGATGSIIAFFLALQLFGDVKPFSWIWAHPLELFPLVLAYFAIGTLWCIAKWWFYCQDEREKYDEMKRSGERMMLPRKPSAAKSKDMILRWMSFWPWSMVWTLINDPIKKAFRAIYRKIQSLLQSLLQSIADKAWKGAE